MQKSEKVWLVCAILIIGLAAAILYHNLIQGLLLGHSYPLNTFLFRPKINFSDFYDIFLPVQHGSPLGSRLAVYFPFSYIPLYPLTRMGMTDALKLVLAAFSFVLFAFFWHKLEFLRGLVRLVAAAIMTFGSYAFLFVVTRANLEMITFCFIIGFLSLLERKRYAWAGVLLACATAMKLYPGAFGILLLKNRQYKASALTAIVTLLLSTGAASLFPGGLFGSINLLSRNLAYFRTHYILDAQGMPFSSSDFSALKLVLMDLGVSVSGGAQAALLPYTLASAIVFVMVVAYILVWENVLWKQVALISISIITLPTVSFDYKLIYMLLPLALFVSASGEERADDRFYSILFGLILIPKAYWAQGEISISVIVNPILLTLMMGHIVWSGLRTSAKEALAA
jgi:hypothetical protein